jgi:hypothetical protein
MCAQNVYDTLISTDTSMETREQGGRTSAMSPFLYDGTRTNGLPLQDEKLQNHFLRLARLRFSGFPAVERAFIHSNCE